MDRPTRKIEIFAPFSAAFDLTKRVLFQPFDLTKWLTIGLAAFLAGLADGTRMNFNFSVPDFSGRAQTQNVDLEAVRSHVDASLIGGVIAAVVVVVLVFVVLFMWLGARGRFMFVDCIVHNRGAVEAPWREYRREGNSLFLWGLLVAGISLLVLLLCALPLLIRYMAEGHVSDFGVGTVVYLIAVVVLFVIGALALTVINWLMVPVMYRQRCSAFSAFMTVVRLIMAEPAPLILYVLFGVVVIIGGSVLSCLVTCLTCCVAALPYVGTVILLPLYTFYYAYLLLFLRQFGREYDAWAHIALSAQASAEPPNEPSPPSKATGEPPPLPA